MNKTIKFFVTLSVSMVSVVVASVVLSAIRSPRSYEGAELDIKVSTGDSLNIDKPTQYLAESDGYFLFDNETDPVIRGEVQEMKPVRIIWPNYFVVSGTIEAGEWKALTGWATVHLTNVSATVSRTTNSSTVSLLTLVVVLVLLVFNAAVITIIWYRPRI